MRSFREGYRRKVMDRRGGLISVVQNRFKSFIGTARLMFHKGVYGEFIILVTMAIAAIFRIRSARSHLGSMESNRRTVHEMQSYNPTDRILAIAGVAQRLKSVLNEYIDCWIMEKPSYLWIGVESRFHFRSYSNSRCTRPIDRVTKQEVYCGPRWSWVSVDGPIRYDLGSGVNQRERRVMVESLSFKPVIENSRKRRKEKRCYA